MAQFTRKAIRDSFLSLLNERPFDKIAVVDIARRCEINRNTFYYYYQDVYALVDEIFKVETQQILEQPLRCATWQEAFLQATQFVRSNRTAVYHLYHSANRERIEKYFYEVTLAGMTAFTSSQAEGLDVCDEDVHALASFYAAALMGLSTKWLGDGMRQEEETYIARISRLLEGNIRLSLERGTRNAGPNG